MFMWFFWDHFCRSDWISPERSVRSCNQTLFFNSCYTCIYSSQYLDNKFPTLLGEIWIILIKHKCGFSVPTFFFFFRRWGVKFAMKELERVPTLYTFTSESVHEIVYANPTKMCWLFIKEVHVLMVKHQDSIKTTKARFPFDVKNW